MPIYAVRQPWPGIKPALCTPLNRSHPLAHGLLASWPAAEGGGTTLGNALGTNHGTITSPGWGSGPHGSVLVCDGTNTFVTTGNPNLNGAWGTFAFWVYADFDTTQLTSHYLFDSTNGTRYLLYKNATGAGAWGLFLNSVAAADSSSSLVGLIPTRVWTHVAIVYNGSELSAKQRVYQNGVLFATFGNSQSYASPANLYLGQRFSAVERWPGRLELFSIWARALSAAEVQQLYGDPLCLHAPTRRVWVMPRQQGPTLAAATLSPAGAIARTPSHASAGSSTPAGTITRTPAHHEAGSSTPVGAVARTPAHQESGSGTPAGTLARTPLAGLSGTLSAGAGTLARSIAATGAAALEASGALARALGGTYDATLAARGNLARTLSTPVATATLAATGALGHVAQIARDATLDVAGSFAGGALHRLYTLLLDATLDLAGLLSREPVRHEAGTLAPDGGLMRTAALVRSGSVLLRGRYVSIFRVVRRAALALAARAARLLAPLREHRVGLLSRLHAVAPVVPARPTAIALPARARTLRLSPERTVPMQLVADDPDAPLVIAPLERNIAFTADFSADIPSGRQIASVAAQVVRLDDPTQTDLSDDFVAAATLTSGHTGVEVIVGNGAQQARATYRVRLIATLNNTPATDLVGYFDLPCRE